MSILGINNPTVQTLSKTGYDRAGKARPVVAAVGDKATVSTDAQMRLAQDLVVGRSQAEIEKLFADIGVDVDESPGTDWSAEATAQRIFDFATAFYQKFADDNPDLDEGSKITAYEDEIGLHFNMADQNCNTFAAAMAEMTGEDIDMTRGLTGMITPAAVRKAYRGCMPKGGRKAIGATADAIGMLGPNELINGVALLLGAGRGVGEHQRGALIQGPTDFVTKSQIVIEWPGGLRAWQREKLDEQAKARSESRRE